MPELITMSPFDLLIEQTDEIGLFLREVLLQHFEYTVRLPRPELFTNAFTKNYLQRYGALAFMRQSEGRLGEVVAVDWSQILCYLYGLLCMPHFDQENRVPELRRRHVHDVGGVVGPHLLQDLPRPRHAQGGRRRGACVCRF